MGRAGESALFVTTIVVGVVAQSNKVAAGVEADAASWDDKCLQSPYPPAAASSLAI